MVMHLAESHCILNRWTNYFCQLLNVHRVHDVRQTEIPAADPTSFEVEVAIEMLKRDKSPGVDQVVAEFVQMGGKNFILILENFSLFGIKKKSTVVPIFTKGNVITVVVL